MNCAAKRLAAGLFLSLCGALVAQAPARADMFGETPLIEAIKDGAVDKVNAALVDGTTPNQRAGDGTPALVLAVTMHSLEIVTLLVEQGARVDIASTDETTPLTLAAANGDTAIVSYLLEKKADVDKQGALRETALIKAVRSHREDIAKILLDHGANPNEADQTGTSVLEIARSSGQPSVVAMLKKKGAT